ncbi:MAG: hypothetical protein KJ051_06825 [Thermoleophilia bacterium]|nr:hypothetical protein [Thermoleophilia bacterium]
MKRIRRTAIASLATLALFVVPAVAFAANVSESDGTAGSAQGEVAGGGSLPFTGLNLTLIVIGALVLLATGVLLRRRGSQNQS